MESKSVLLGVYTSKTFLHLAYTYNVLAYPFGYKHIDYFSYNLVKTVCDNCHKIHFVLDDIGVPLDKIKSKTCEELIMILEEPALLKKTQFWLNFKKIKRESIKALMLKIKEEDFKPQPLKSIYEKKISIR